jgi:thioredoxin 1
MLAPILEEFAEETSDIKIVSVNIDDEAQLAEEYEVSSIPCLVLFEGGKEVKRSVGLIPKAKLGKFVK